MIKILQILAVNLPLVFDTSGVSLVSGTDLIAFKELSKAIDAIQKAGSVSEALANSDAKVSVSVGKGHSNSDSQVQNHTEINADRLTIKAKETTTLKGATANINHLALDTKNLHIESVQDIEKYDSKQTQGGVKAAFAWGSGASGSVQFSRNKANVDYAQVNQQSGFNIKESSTINVEENTHLKGGVINAQGDKANHSLKTGTLTTESIENRSDIKVSSISAGVSSDMTQMATSAMGAALSALGNTNESERSQTQAAISSNINVQITDSEAQKQKTGKTAEEALQSLNRDTQNANSKLDKQDLTKAQERQEATQIVAEIGAKRVGDFAQYMGWEDGSPQKIALHGLIGYLSAKVGGGNTAASTLSAMGSEYINTEIANYLQENTALTADQRNAIQQASAAGLGALIGASLGGDSNTVNQSAQMAWRTEKFNRQLHPDEMKWIKAHAKEFAEQEGLTVEEAEKRLSQQAAKELDILWFLKLDSSTDDKAKAFLASQNNATFIDSKGDVQHYFVAKDNDFWISRKYASDAYDYMQATGDNFYGRNLQTNTTVWEGTKDKLGKAYDHISENKLETAKAVGNAVIDSVVECSSDVTGCLGNFVAELWTKGTSSASEMSKNLVLSDQEKINALYGQDVEKEMVAVSSSQFVATLTEALGVGKIITKAGKEVIGASVKEIKAPVKDVVNSPKELVDEVLETAARETSRTCSFRGDMEVKTEKGYQPISTIKVDDKVLAKNEVTGITTYQKVQAHYSNPYDYTVYVEVKDSQGKYQTIVSNKIHPFFTQVLNGTAPISSEGHNYKGKIAKGQWVDAQHLKQGYRLFSESGEWQTVYKVTIQSEKLQAYNLTVDEDHTYFIKGAKTDSQGVWVHNDCWNKLPKSAIETGKTTPDGRKLYTFKDEKGNQVTAYQGSDGRYYNPKVYSPNNPINVNVKAVDYYPNRNGALATKGEVYYTTPEATEAAKKLGFEKTNQTIKGEAIYKDNKGRYITVDVGNGRNKGGAHNGGVWKMADSIKNLGKKETRMGTYDANLNRIGD